MRVAVPVPAIPGVVLRVGKAGQGRGATRLEDLGANLLQWIGFQGEFTIYSPIFYVYFMGKSMASGRPGLSASQCLAGASGSTLLVPF